MATQCTEVYDAFLARILEDEWQQWLIDDAKADWYQIMCAALPWFKFPRKSLEHNETQFTDTLDNEEIQIIANYMKCEWLNRCVMTWENIKPLYVERDFSPANLLDKLNDSIKAERKNALNQESIYYRSRKGKPFDFTRLASRADDK